ncbi:MAG: DNA recombination protein RmuC [Alphaproteobacteria bacterium]
MEAFTLQDLDPATVLAAAAAIGGGLLIALLAMTVALVRRAGASRRAVGGVDDRVARLTESTTRLGAGQAELVGRLSQMAEQGAAAQSQLAERLQAQERQIAKALDERLTAVTAKVHESLDRTASQTATTIGDLKTRLALIDEAQKNIAQLSTQVVGLQDILSNKQARGAFGEVQLIDIVSAILPPSAYQFQATLAGGRRADCLLKLPNPPGPIVVDAKFPLESYRALDAATDDAARQQAARAFTADVRKHVADIAERYIVPGETAESALMFLPSEAVYAELHARFGKVVEESYRRRVWIVSPTTLMATLNTVRAVLKDVHMREQAGVIQAEIHHLLKDVERLDERVERLQRHFAQADKDIREIRISTDKVTRRGERIEELQLEDAAPDEELEPPRPRVVGE